MEAIRVVRLKSKAKLKDLKNFQAIKKPKRKRLKIKIMSIIYYRQKFLQQTTKYTNQNITLIIILRLQAII